MVDRIAHPVGLADPGNRNIANGAKSPPVTILVRHGQAGRPPGRPRPLLLRPGSSKLNPAREYTHLVIRKLLLRRHLQLRVLVADSPDQQARPGIAGNDGGAGFPPGKDGIMPVQAQLTLLLLLPMALEAAFREQRANLALEELKSLSGGGRIGSKPAAKNE